MNVDTLLHYYYVKVSACCSYFSEGICVYIYVYGVI